MIPVSWWDLLQISFGLILLAFFLGAGAVLLAYIAACGAHFMRWLIRQIERLGT